MMQTHVRNIWRSKEVLQMLVVALVFLRLDYRSAIVTLAGLLKQLWTDSNLCGMLLHG